jgi:hypothetical protein
VGDWLGCIQIVSGRLVGMHTDSKWESDSLYLTLLLCLSTMLWKHLDVCKSLYVLGHCISCRPIVSSTFQLFCPRDCHHFTLARKLNGCRVGLDRVVLKEHPGCAGNAAVVFTCSQLHYFVPQSLY